MVLKVTHYPEWKKKQLTFVLVLRHFENKKELPKKENALRYYFVTKKEKL